MMNERDVVELLQEIERLGVAAWVGGGWGVDALIGNETRPHGDIDIYVAAHGADKFLDMLKSRGYTEVVTEYTTQAHTVWQDLQGRVVDLHLIEFREDDAQSLYFEGEAYPRWVLDGEGSIGGLSVRCFTAEAQLLFHQGYEHSEKDIQDVLLLCKTYGLEVPEEYKNI